MIEFNRFLEVFNKTIFDASKAKLFEKVAKYPDRYIGIFRPTKPKAKLLQNLLQSHEILFGDAFEKIIEEYFIKNGYEVLDKQMNFLEDGKIRVLNIDQLVRKNGNIVFIEQKVRDDHDSSKKRGQIDNFEAKLNAIIEKYGDKNIKSFFYFIDPGFVKNKSYYATQLIRLSDNYGIECKVSYGEEIFRELNILSSWEEILTHLKNWKVNIQELPEINFDLNADDSFKDIKDLPPKVFLAVFSNNDIQKQILPVLFPENKVLILLKEYFVKKDKKVYSNLAERIDAYMQQ